MANKQEIVKNWKDQAQINWKTANNLNESKDYYASLFFCHLTIEKMLKGLVLDYTSKPAPYIHDLVRLVKMIDIEPSKEQISDLNDLTGFNILTRYNDEKAEFFKKSTRAYTKKYLEKTEKLYKWLRKQFRKK